LKIDDEAERFRHRAAAELKTNVGDFNRNFNPVLNRKAERLARIPEVRRVLRLMDACWSSAEAGTRVAFE